MVEKETVLCPEAGLHARPATMFVKRAKRFDSDTRVVKGGREANAKSTRKVVTPGAKKDDKILVRASRMVRGRSPRRFPPAGRAIAAPAARAPATPFPGAAHHPGR